MSTKARDQYVKKTREYLEAQIRGLRDGESWEGTYLEPLDALWEQMTPTERSVASQRIEALKEEIS